jgi:hypothetical protein
VTVQAEHDDSHYSSDYFEYEHQEASPPEAGRYAYDNRNYGTRQDVYSREERFVLCSFDPIYQAQSVIKGYNRF